MSGYKRIQDGHKDVKDDEYSRRSCISITVNKVEKMKKLIMDDRRITIGHVVDNVDTSVGL